MMEIGEIVRLLAQGAESLARELLPGGRREGREWVAGDLAGSPGRGVSVCIAGPKAGIWGDFSAGLHGDALDLVAVCRFGGNKTEALKWARGWLGLGEARSGGRAPAPPPPRPRDVEGERREAEQRRQKGRGLWAAGVPIPGTPAEVYLAGRGISLEALGRAPNVLRFNARTWCTERGAAHPAMVALIQDQGFTIGAHRTFLAPDGRGKARIKAAKKVLGATDGGLIPLWRGASDKPLKDAPEGDTIAIAEGIEDALTIALHCPEWRVVACVSIGNMAKLTLPPTIMDVRLCFDRDGENPAVRTARERAIDRYMREGRSVFAMQPAEGFKDFNEEHQAALRGRRGAA
ncbi:hypothetical protein GXW78_16950 [Roseomonas terrae]|uniref:Toprim domain-containing protein n=1 Tax=Neoroseomonas terrae TaxID=424799 RepID=A0ABS5EK04_9PROT|nr:toprim domain-containing protein [Neoroseomonas terrae]MBR0651364.1 hypothetical protein [Neoroseomonas terrae]